MQIIILKKFLFINKFFNEKRSKEGGTGNSATKKIVRFCIDGVPLSIYDIPGFEDDNTIKIVYEKLCEATNEMKNDRDIIHIIIYFINYENETLFFKWKKQL